MSIMLAPLPPAARALAELPRHQLEMLIEIALNLLDATAPDPDREFDADGGCEAGDDGYYVPGRDLMPGDSEDYEESDPPETDNEDACAAADDRIEGAPLSLVGDDEDREPDQHLYPGDVIQFPRARRS
jgi:hypothetical protein